MILVTVTTIHYVVQQVEHLTHHPQTSNKVTVDTALVSTASKLGIPLVIVLHAGLLGVLSPMELINKAVPLSTLYFYLIIDDCYKKRKYYLS